MRRSTGDGAPARGCGGKFLCHVPSDQIRNPWARHRLSRVPAQGAISGHFPLCTFSAISWRAQGGTWTVAPPSSLCRASDVNCDGETRDQANTCVSIKTVLKHHTPQAHPWSLARRSRGRCLGSRPPQEGQDACNPMGTIRAAGTPSRAMMTSSPASTAARSCDSFAFASASFICIATSPRTAWTNLRPVCVPVQGRPWVGPR